MKDKSMYVIMLLIIVAAIFVFKPDMFKLSEEDGSTTFAVVTNDQEVQSQDNLTVVYSEVITDIQCLDIDDCVEAIREQGYTEEIRASCTNMVCIFEMERLVVGGISE
jgi:hypothetical protein